VATISSQLSNSPAIPLCASAGAGARLAWHERAALFIGIWEILLQIDTYLMFHEQDSDLGAVGGINISVTTVCFGYLFLVKSLRAASLQSQPDFRHMVTNIPMLIYIATVALSALVATVYALTFFEVALLVQAYALFFYIANCIHNEEDLEFGLTTLATALGFQGVVMIVLDLIGTPGESFQFGPITASVWEDGRPAGTVHSAVVIGSMMAIMWLPTVALALTARKRLTRHIAILCSALGMLGILLSESRGAVLSIILGSAIFGSYLWSRRWLPKYTFAFLFVIGLISLYPLSQLVLKRVVGDDGDSASARKHHTLIAVDTIAKAPIVGHGAGNCHIACKESADNQNFRSEWYYTVHSKFLVVWVETGIVGIVSFFGGLPDPHGFVTPIGCMPLWESPY
jgi:hypothetical protein